MTLDPRVLVIMLALYGSIWAVRKVGSGIHHLKQHHSAHSAKSTKRKSTQKSTANSDVQQHPA